MTGDGGGRQGVASSRRRESTRAGAPPQDNTRSASKRGSTPVMLPPQDNTSSLPPRRSAPAMLPRRSTSTRHHQRWPALIRRRRADQQPRCHRPGPKGSADWCGTAGLALLPGAKADTPVANAPRWGARARVGARRSSPLPALLGADPERIRGTIYRRCPLG